MKILAGRFGGRKIKTSKNLPYRPTKSLVRKSLFDHLTPFEYDSVLDLPFEIPFYGDHVSLFTLLMTISTLLYTRMNSQMSGPQMAQMKWIMYLMPIMFLGFFNNYAAGLSYYYFLANMVTFGQQFVMRKYFINEDAILTQIENNKKKPVKKSKFQKRLEEMAKKQQEAANKRR